MDDRLQPMKDVASPYINDILIGMWVEPGKDLLAAHNRDVRKVLELLKRGEFIVGKWKLFLKEVKFCGHIFGGGSQTRPWKTQSHLKMGGTPDGFSPKGLFGVQKLIFLLYKGLRKYSCKTNGKAKGA